MDILDWYSVFIFLNKNWTENGKCFYSTLNFYSLSEKFLFINEGFDFWIVICNFVNLHGHESSHELKISKSNVLFFLNSFFCVLISPCTYTKTLDISVSSTISIVNRSIFIFKNLFIQEDFTDIETGNPVTSQPQPGQGTSSAVPMPAPAPSSNPTNPFANLATEATSLNTSEQTTYTPGKWWFSESLLYC